MTIDTRTCGDAFTLFFRDAEPKLRRALTAAVGAETGKDAAAEALAYGWQHWTRVGAMENPTGYLYRVGRSKARSRRMRPLLLAPEATHSEPWCEPALRSSLEHLSERQRVSLMLIHGFGYTPTEAAGLLGVTAGAAHKHAERGLEKVRALLKVGTHE